MDCTRPGEALPLGHKIIGTQLIIMASSSCFCKRNLEELSLCWCYLYTELLDCVVFLMLWLLLVKILHSGECAQLCFIQTHWDQHSAVSSVGDTSAHLVFCQPGTTVCLLTWRRWDAVCWLVFVLFCMGILCSVIYRLPGSDSWGTFTQKMFVFKALTACV